MNNNLIENIHPNSKNLLELSNEPTKKEYQELRPIIEGLTMLENKFRNNNNYQVGEFKVQNMNGTFTLTDNQNKTIKFQTLSSVFSDVFDVKTLTSINRLGNCHGVSIDIAMLFEKSLLITGTIDKNNKNIKMVHSWIELENGDDGLVIDYTKNLMCIKTLYYEIYNVRVINKIPAYKVKKDINKLESLDIEYIPKLYCLFDTLYIKDAQKMYQKTFK